MASHDLSDETLMAYADGELDAAAAAEVAKAAARDPVLAERIALFRRTAEALAQARAARPAAPVPEALTARVQATLAAGRATPGGATDTARVLPFARPEMAAPRRAWAPAAWAASLALAVGLGAGLSLRPAAPPAGAPGLAALEAGGIAAALSRLETGASERVPAGEVTLISSFRTPEGAFCREFELAEVRAVTVGVACAEEAAPGWALRFAVAQPAAPAADDAAIYAPAGALEALDTWLMGIGAGAPLSPQEERGALRALAD